jgi:hypothetical protein
MTRRTLHGYPFGRKKKLPKRAKELLECLTCHIEACSNGPVSLNATAFGVISILAGSLNLHPDVHREFAEAGWIASRAQIKALGTAVKKLQKGRRK